jgi:uncharacterized protein YuzE
LNVAKSIKKTMLISYDPNTDVLNITLRPAPVAQTQPQGGATVGFDALGEVVSIAVADASTRLWERGGQVQVLLPEAGPLG